MWWRVVAGWCGGVVAVWCGMMWFGLLSNFT